MIEMKGVVCCRMPGWFTRYVQECVCYKRGREKIEREANEQGQGGKGEIKKRK